MKKLLVLSTIVLLAINANAQFQKGNRVLGFGLNLQSINNNSLYPASESTNKGFTLGGSVSLAKAKSETRLNGFTLYAGYGKSKVNNIGPVNSNQFSEDYSAGLGYFMRKYQSLGKNFFVFGEAQASFNYSRQLMRYGVSSSDNNNYGGTIGIYPGLAYKWNDRFLFELRFADFAALSYNYTEQRSGNSDVYNRAVSFGTSLGLGYLHNIGIGARWIIK
nr:hypothetical protein [uncultured Lacibacter sp.]